MSLLHWELDEVIHCLDQVKDRNMLTQAATIEREIGWAWKVFAEFTRSADGKNVYTFMILRANQTWHSISRTMK